jgi:hypothetical protein
MQKWSILQDEISTLNAVNKTTAQNMKQNRTPERKNTQIHNYVWRFQHSFLSNRNGLPKIIKDTEE